jgi:hypothetical protein
MTASPLQLRAFHPAVVPCRAQPGPQFSFHRAYSITHGKTCQPPAVPTVRCPLVPTRSSLRSLRLLFYFESRPRPGTIKDSLVERYKDSLVERYLVFEVEPCGPIAPREAMPSLPCQTGAVAGRSCAARFHRELGCMMVWRPLCCAWGLLALWCAAGAFGQEARERFIVHHIRAEGSAQGKNVKLTIQLQAESTTDDLVRIPLRLDECILTEQKFTGEAKQYLKDEGSRGGYAWYLQGKGKSCQLELSALLPLRIAANEMQFRFTAPQVQQADAVLKLLVPGDVAAGELLGGEQPEDPIHTAEGTRFTFRRLGGPFTFSWHPRREDMPEANKLQARVFVKSRFDGATQEFRSDARITVFGSGGTFGEFQLRLPPGANLAEDNPESFTLERSTAPAQGHVLRVRHEPSKRYTVALALRHDSAVKNPTELGRYEVLGALRQWGLVAVEVDETWQVRWPTLNPQHAERTDVSELPKEFLEELKLVPGRARAAFELYSAEASVQVRCFRSKPKISVKQEYVLWVEPERLRLEATLEYSLDRGLGQLQIQWPVNEEWQVEEVGPPHIVQSVSTDPATGAKGAKPAGRLTTVDVKGAGNSFTLRIKASRRLGTEDKMVALGLPQPQGAQVLTSRLWVQGADNVSLTPQGESLSGLTPLAALPAIPDALATPPYVTSPLVYQAEAHVAPRFAASFAKQNRKLSVHASGEVTLDANLVRVKQRFVYKLQHEPLRELLLRLPEGAASAQQLTVYLNDQRLENPRFFDEPAGKAASAESSRGKKRLVLPVVMRPGTFTLRLEFTRPGTISATRVSEQGAPLTVPLVMPAEEKFDLAENTLRIEAQPGHSVQLAWPDPPELPVPWRSAAGSEVVTTRNDVLLLEADEEAGEVSLEISGKATPAKPKPVLDRLWLRTEVSDQWRADHLWCQVSGPQPPLRFLMPSLEGPVRVTVDGRPVPSDVSSGGELVIPLDQLTANETKPHLLEIEYQVRQGLSSSALNVARPDDDTCVRQAYWQLVVPDDHHLLSSPSGLTREFTWRWGRWHFSRVAAVDWAAGPLGSRSADALGSANGRHEYLFSTLGPLPALSLRVMHRTWLVLLASGGAFGLGMLLMYVPAVRRREVLLGAAALLSVVSLLLPEPMLVMAQAASLGLAAALIMALLKWLLEAVRPSSLRLAGGATLGSSIAYEVGSKPPGSNGQSAPVSASSQSAAKAPALAPAVAVPQREATP